MKHELTDVVMPRLSPKELDQSRRIKKLYSELANAQHEVTQTNSELQQTKKMLAYILNACGGVVELTDLDIIGLGYDYNIKTEYHIIDKVLTIELDRGVKRG